MIEQYIQPPVDSAEELMDFLGLPREAKYEYYAVFLDTESISYLIKVVESRLSGERVSLADAIPGNNNPIKKHLRRIYKDNPFRFSVQSKVLESTAERLNLAIIPKSMEELMDQLFKNKEDDEHEDEEGDEEPLDLAEEYEQIIQGAMEAKHQAIPYLAHGLTADIILRHPIPFMRAVLQMGRQKH